MRLSLPQPGVVQGLSRQGEPRRLIVPGRALADHAAAQRAPGANRRTLPSEQWDLRTRVLAIPSAHTHCRRNSCAAQRTHAESRGAPLRLPRRRVDPLCRRIRSYWARPGFQVLPSRPFRNTPQSPRPTQFDRGLKKSPFTLPPCSRCRTGKGFTTSTIRLVRLERGDDVVDRQVIGRSELGSD